MVVKLSVTAALDARDTKLREESIYLDPGSLYRNRSSQLGVAADTIYSEVDSRTMARQRDKAFVQNEEIFERPMTAADIAEKAKASSRGIMLNPNSSQFQNVQAQLVQQNIARIESAQPQNQGMVVVQMDKDQTPSLLRANNEQRTSRVEVSRSRSGSTVTPARAEQIESRVFRDSVRASRSSGSRRRSQPSESSNSPLVLGGHTAAVLAERSYTRKPNTMEEFVADLVKSREPKENAVEGILSRREAAKNSSELMALPS